MIYRNCTFRGFKHFISRDSINNILINIIINCCLLKKNLLIKKTFFMYFVVMSVSFKFFFILGLSFILLGIIIDHVRAFSTFSDDQSMLFK